MLNVIARVALNGLLIVDVSKTALLDCTVASGSTSDTGVGTITSFGALKMRVERGGDCDYPRFDPLIVSLKAPGFDRPNVAITSNKARMPIYRICGKDVRVFLEATPCARYPIVSVEAQDPF